MIRSLLIAALALALPSSALAQEEGGAPEAKTGEAAPPAEGEATAPDASVDRFRTPVEVLTERMIGTASRAIRYDWRKSTVGFGVIGSELLERNNFGSTRLGGFARMPFGDFMGEVAVSWAHTWPTDSTEKLALTPYRQFGRPSRLELDLGVGYPVAEGIVTAWPGWFPPTELVFSLDAGLRYLYYPGMQSGARFRDAALALMSPRISSRELRNLEKHRPGGMQIDPARYGLMAGTSLDLYFQTGGFISPRVMVAVPLLSTANATGLGWWWELTLRLGWAI